MKFLLLALLLPAVTYAGLVTHYPCTYGYPSGPTPDVPSWVEVDGCDETRCDVLNGASTLMRAAFSPLSRHESLRFHLRIFFGGISMPVEQPPNFQNACQYIQGGCPVEAGQGETVSELLLEQRSPLDGLTVRIEVSLIDNNTDETVVCGGVQIHII